MQKIYGLNYIRGICAVLVMLYHYTTRYDELILGIPASQNHTGLYWGCWAVSAFFILSGLLTVANVNDKLTAKEFIIKRIIRLYPAYWIAILLTTIITYMTNFSMKVDIFSTVANFTMLQGFVGISSVDGAYWTLRYELWFYFLIAVSLLFKKKNYSILSSIWLIFLVALGILVKKIGINNIAISIVKIVLMYGYGQVFIIGISLWEILKNKRNVLSYVNLIVSFCIEFSLNSVGRCLFVAAVSVIIAIFSITNLKLKYDNGLNFLAEISFPLYLIHQNIGYILIEKFTNIGIGRVVGTAITVCLCVTVAGLIHFYIEKPISNWMRIRKNKEYKKDSVLV